jgi:hypothetical protein
MTPRPTIIAGARSCKSLVEADELTGSCRSNSSHHSFDSRTNHFAAIELAS